MVGQPKRPIAGAQEGVQLLFAIGRGVPALYFGRKRPQVQIGQQDFLPLIQQREVLRDQRKRDILHSALHVDSRGRTFQIERTDKRRFPAGIQGGQQILRLPDILRHGKAEPFHTGEDKFHILPSADNREKAPAEMDVFPDIVKVIEEPGLPFGQQVQQGVPFGKVCRPAFLVVPGMLPAVFQRSPVDVRR